MLNQFKDNIAHIILTLFLILILSHFIFLLLLVKNFKSNYSAFTSIDSIVVLTGDKFRISKGMEIDNSVTLQDFQSSSFSFILSLDPTSVKSSNNSLGNIDYASAFSPFKYNS